MDEHPSGKYGPNLKALKGRKAGSLQDFEYSPAMKMSGANGLVWTRITLEEFIGSPRSYVVGTSMDFLGIRNPQKRSELVEWLMENSK